MTMNPDSPRWFAIGAPYRNEMKVCDALNRMGVQTFLPVVTRVEVIAGRKKSKTVPAVSNLLFVHCTETRLKEVKPQIPRLQYKINIGEKGPCKVIVPDPEMENFIRFMTGADSGTKFIDPSEINFKTGTKVRVTAGVFNGVTGTLVKIKGRRSKVLSINLEGVVCAVVDIAPEFVQNVE